MDSPCRQRCALVNDVCTGCKRTKEEVIKWTTYTEVERKNIIQQCKRRWK